MPSPLKLYAMTLNDFLLHEDETIRRNAMSILKRLQKLKEVTPCKECGDKRCPPHYCDKKGINYP